MSGGNALHILVRSHVSMTSLRHPISCALWVRWDFPLPRPVSHIYTMDEIIQFYYPENIERKTTKLNRDLKTNCGYEVLRTLFLRTIWMPGVC